MRLHEARTGQRDQGGLREFGIEVPVEVGEGLDCHDPGLFETAGEEAIGAAHEFIVDEEFQKLEVRERRGFGLRDAPG